ncbi:hypothetical protein ABL78_3485 [Leptomonas seymouri]|uniref:Uncharacterized protein n=1 Tax=Leptomonas seymouri TaxID=5684 RepID=A0A0N1I7N5_LEPSE|nr:hypothetical protein ABL78_3485 [Leptomonas seymouri]|eukprot:KPI87401.1 hypothetical protein ABL78_3485 [Leptomonas seymouri]
MSLEHSTEDDALLVRLIEEGLFLSHADKCKGNDKASSMSDDHKYLVEHVFPTLVPALHDLLKCYKSRIMAVQDVAADDNHKPDPVMWLAQYLIRNNAHCKTSRLADHPFRLINNAVLNEEHSDE